MNRKNVITERKLIAQTYKEALNRTYYELIASENLQNPPRIEIGNPGENPTILNRNDAGGERGIWAQAEIYGKWNVKINAGWYDVKCRFLDPLTGGGRMMLETNGIINRKENSEDNQEVIVMKNIYLPQMEGELLPYYMIGGKKILPFWIEMEKVN